MLGRGVSFENLYIYLTNNCNYICKHCYLGSRLSKNEVMELADVYEHLETWRSLGSKKVCFIGGEPTLYPYLEDAVIRAAELGYEKIIIGSNGSQYAREVFNALPLEVISYIQISLDGAKKDTHDFIRQKGAFDEAVKTIQFLRKKCVDVRIIMTVNNYNIHEIIPMIQLGEKLGVTLVKFHIMSEIGMAHSSKLQAVSPRDWIKCCEKINQYCEYNLKGATSVSYQTAYANFGDNKLLRTYKGCVGNELERISVFPDGKCYICSFLFDYDISYAKLENRKIIKNQNSEFDKFILDTCKRCMKKCSYGGCIAENIVNGYDFCSRNPEIHPVCRLWKYEIRPQK